MDSSQPNPPLPAAETLLRPLEPSSKDSSKGTLGLSPEGLAVSEMPAEKTPTTSQFDFGAAPAVRSVHSVLSSVTAAVISVFLLVLMIGSLDLPRWVSYSLLLAGTMPIYILFLHRT